MQPEDLFGQIGPALIRMLPSIMKYLGYFLIAFLIIGGLATLWYTLQFTLKVDVFPLYGSGKDGIFSVAKRKKNKVRWIKNRTAWRAMFPLFNKKDIEPFDSEYIYPGNQVYAFDLNGEWTPGRINVDKTENDFRAEINPVPYYVRNWQSLQHKKHAQEFAENNWWADNKSLILGLVVGLACLTLCGVTIWFNFKYAGGEGMKIIQSNNDLASAIQGWGVID